MPRPSKGIRLWLRPPETEDTGRVIRNPQWIIRDGRKSIPTGCGPGAREQADLRLAAYLESRYAAPRRERRLHEIQVADVIAIYLEDVAPNQARPAEAGKRAKRLLAYWGNKTLSDVTGANCRAYTATRGSSGGARRDLQDLSAAIQHHHREGYHREDVLVALPPRGGRRERWLTRAEIARLVRSAWRQRERMRRSHSDKTADKLPTKKLTGRHVARAILLAYYTGSRIGDVLRASWKIGPSVSYLNLEAGFFHRRPTGKEETSKRQPTIRLSSRLLSHLRRWKEANLCKAYVVEWEKQPVASISKAFARAVKSAGLEGKVTPHTLRHSRATHLKQAGVSSWEVGGYLGMSEQMVDKVYGHHDPANQARAANAR